MMIALGLSIVLSTARAEAPLDPNALARALGTPMTDDRVFYRWQSTTSGENLARLGALDERADRHFMALTKDIAAGPGLYVADRPHSSSEYLPETGGNVIEARVARGTIMVDLENPTVTDKARKLGLSSVQVAEALDRAEGVIVRYTNDWYVAKNVAGKVHFTMYPGPEQTRDDIVNAFARMGIRRAQAQFAAQVRARRPELRAELLREIPFNPLSLAMVDGHELGAHLKAHAADVKAGSELDHVYQLLKRRPDDLASALRDPSLGPEFPRRLLEGPLAHRSALDRAPIAVAEAFGARTDLGPGASARVGNSLIKRFFDRKDAYAALPENLPRLLAWAKLRPVDQDTRDALGLNFRRLLGEAHPTAAQSSAMSRLLVATGQYGSSIYETVEALRDRHQNLARAVRTRQPADITKALTEVDDLREFGAAARELHQAVGPSFSKVMAKHLRDHPNQLPSLLKTETDWARALAPDFRADLGHDLFPELWRAAQATDASAFITHCLRTTACAEKFARAAATDGARVLKTPGEFKALGKALESLAYQHGGPPKLVDAIYKSALAAVRDSPSMIALAPVSGALAKWNAYIQRVEAMGVANFRADHLLQLARNPATSRAAERTLLDAALDHAVNPAEVARAAEHLEPLPDTAARVRARLSTLGANAEEWRALEERGWPVRAAVAPTGPAHCLNLLARLLEN